MNTVIHTLWSWWMKFAHAIGYINNRIILSLVYFIIFGMYAIPQKISEYMWGKKNMSGWIQKTSPANVIERLERQY